MRSMWLVENGTFQNHSLHLVVNLLVKFSLTNKLTRLYFFPGLFLIIFSYFCSFMVVWGLGSKIGFLGLGFSVDWVWGLWCGAFWVFLGLGSL